jgi:D-alanyl-D-alanine carboxypeptidase
MAFTFSAGAANAVHAQPPAPPQAILVVSAKTNETLIEKDPDKKVHPASLAKMMTLYLTFEALEKGTLRLDQKLSVSAEAADLGNMRISLKLKEKETLTVEEAIYGLAVQSANDASVVLAEAIGGTGENFVRMMNAKAKELGMTNTNFENPHGLPDPEQVTTARDMVTLSKAHLKAFPQYQKYFEAKEFTYKGTTYASHNKLMNRLPEIDFGKTGFVNASGFNMALSAKRGETRLFAATFGGASAVGRDDKMEELLNEAFEKEVILAAQGKNPLAAVIENKSPEPPLTKVSDMDIPAVRKTEEKVKPFSPPPGTI